MSVPEGELALPASRELAIDFNQNFRVEQRAVSDPPRAIDAIAIAQGVQAVRLSGVLSAREQKRVDDALDADRLAAEPRQLRVDEAHIEFGIVDDERGIADEGEKFVDDAGEDRLVLEGGDGVAVNARRIFRNVAFRVDQPMENPSRHRLVNYFDRADFQHPVPLLGIEARRFRVEHDFTHEVVNLWRAQPLRA